MFKQERRDLKMANVFANVLGALAKVMNNGTATFTLMGYWDETECPKEML